MARILVNSEGKERVSTVNILEGPRSFELQVWWELPPWSEGLYPSKGISVTGLYKPEEEDEHTTHVCQSASEHQVFGNDGGQRFQKEGMADKTIAVSKAWAHVMEKEVGRSEDIKSGRFQVLGETWKVGQIHI